MNNENLVILNPETETPNDQHLTIYSFDGSYLGELCVG